jgi:hypothetical protein
MGIIPVQMVYQYEENYDTIILIQWIFEQPAFRSFFSFTNPYVPMN